MATNHTIAALATAPLPAGVGVIRLSGPQALSAAQSLTNLKEVKARYAHFTKLHHPKTGEHLDDALLLYFPNPHSFTGENVVELHCHGGRAVIQNVLNALFEQGIKQAEAGEFTKRAVLNGKLDLTAAEGLADLIAAETSAQHTQALRQLGGELGTLFEEWRTQILTLLAHVEAAIDFPDEELEILNDAGLADKLQTLIQTFDQALATQAGERIRDGFRIAIIGKPNAGKSTLTNLLTGKETAIVSPIEGTTRDVLEAHLTIGGYPVILADTAGLRLTNDEIEAEGVRRAEQQVSTADLILTVIDAAEYPNIDEKIQTLTAEKTEDTLTILSKTDETQPPENLPENTLSLNLLDKSASLPPLLNFLEEALQTRAASAAQAALLTRKRHRESLSNAKNHLTHAHTLFTKQAENTMSLSDLLAQDLRDAAQSIGRVTGAVTSEDVLDVVFSTFCIGK